MDFRYGRPTNVFPGAAGKSLSAMIAMMYLGLLNNPGFQTFTKMYHSCVVPISYYYFGIWGFNYFDFMNKIQNRACRYHLGLHRYYLGKTETMCQNKDYLIFYNMAVLTCKLYNYHKPYLHKCIYYSFLIHDIYYTW